uniref:Uncharacterized protein n=1 Tax=Oryza meridionalis TaxID=40149 RepID=A0A0E0D2Q5_9ORYZ
MDGDRFWKAKSGFYPREVTYAWIFGSTELDVHMLFDKVTTNSFIKYSGATWVPYRRPLATMQGVSPGLVGPVQDIRFSTDTSFYFGSLDFTANKVGALRPLNPSISDPAATSPVPFDLYNFAALVAKIDFHDNRTLHDKVATTPTKRPGHHGRSKHRRP